MVGYLRWILKNSVQVWTECKWLKLQSVRGFCKHGNEPIYYNGTDICAHVYSSSFAIQSTTEQFLLDGELLTETSMYNTQPISAQYYSCNSYVGTF